MALKEKLIYSIVALCISCSVSASEKSDALLLSISESAGNHMCSSEGSPVRKKAKYDSEIEECVRTFMDVSIVCEKEIFNGSFLEKFTSMEHGLETMNKLNKCTDEKFANSKWYKDFVILRVVN